MILIVFNNFPRPSKAKYSHWIGTMIESETANAFKVKIPSEGAQSMII